MDKNEQTAIITLAKLDNSSNKIEVIVKYNKNIKFLEKEIGAEVEDLGLDYAIVTLEIDKLGKLFDYNEINYIELPKNLTYVTYQSMQKSCIDYVGTKSSFNLHGTGTLIGIIDSGIDYTHPDFIDNDGNTRIVSIWDQTLDGVAPAGFKDGIEYNEDTINEAIHSANPYSIVEQQDIIGHGTALAGIAAGNGRSSNFKNVGVAPEASLLIVKLGQKGRESFFLTTEIMRAIKYAIDKAEVLGMPIAINLSFGTNNGSHDGNSLFETYINEISEKWKTSIVVAMGNEGFGGSHYHHKFTNNETTDAEFVISANLKSFYLSLWKSFTDRASFELISPNGRTTGIISPNNQLAKLSIDDTNIFAFISQPRHYNKNQEIYFYLTNTTNEIPVGVWRLKIITTTVVDGNIDVWLPTIEEVGTEAIFSSPTTTTTLTIPATVKNVISVGGYDSQIDAFALFSGQGNTRDTNIKKPNLVAPGVEITSTKKGGGYDVYTGTSIAAPFVTGSAALLMEWGIIKNNDSFLYGERIKAYLETGAKRKMNVNYPNTSWGFGTLCLQTSLELLEQFQKGSY